MSLLRFFRKKKAELSDEQKKENKMWALWEEERAESPYQELMTYQSEVNNGGHDQLSPHVLIQSMRTSFCIFRLINRQNTGYNCRIRVMGARIGLLVIIFPNQTSSHPAIFSLLIPTFRGRNQRFIVECTLLWTITGYRPQCKVSSKVS